MDRILSAPASTVRAILVALCDDDIRLEARSLKYLDQLENHGPVPPTAAESSSRRDSSKSRKRKAAGPPPQICTQCKQVLGTGETPTGACLYHEGDLQIDEDHDIGVDCGEGTGGSRDTPENQEDHPEGFTWTCCGKSGTKSGCAKGSYPVVREVSWKRRRLGQWADANADSEEVRVFEGRVLKANEFVNETLWHDDWDTVVSISEAARARSAEYAALGSDDGYGSKTTEGASLVDEIESGGSEKGDQEDYPTTDPIQLP